MDNKDISEVIVGIVEGLMNRVMERVLVEDPFIPEKHHAAKPIYAALVPDEIFKGAHFERRFVTPFGNTWEKLALASANVYHSHGSKGQTIEGTIGEERLRRIQEVLNRLEHGVASEKKATPNWTEEIEYILKGEGPAVPVAVVCDIYVDSQLTKKKYAFELKGPLPNSDQTKVSKEKMFKLMAMNEHPVDYAYYALPYNPYGNRQSYNWAFPQRWFDMKNDECVLIGRELWDVIGGVGTYDKFISEINKLGVEYKERIYREYLGIEPPIGFDSNRMK